MKINLGCGADIRHNYMNIDRIPITNLPNSIFQQGDISNLDWFCQNESIEEILALKVLQCFNINNLSDIINAWKCKLSQDGVLKISIIDALSVCTDFARTTLDIHHFNQIIFNNDGTNLCCIDSHYLQQILKENNFKILTSKFAGPEFYVEAQKC